MRIVFVLILTCKIFATSAENRELVPHEAPSNLTLLEILDHQVVLDWQPIEPNTVRGNFRGYVVRTWNHIGSQVYAYPPDVTRANVGFYPYSKNFITVSVRNEKYVGPPSDAISFDAPQVAPSQVVSLKYYPLSSKAILLRWEKPTQPNGLIIGYKIECRIVNATFTNEALGRGVVSHTIHNPDKHQAKLTGIEEGVRYEVLISALNCAGESEKKTSIEVFLESNSPAVPFQSRLRYKIGFKPFDSDKECAQSAVKQQEEEEDAVQIDFVGDNNEEGEGNSPPQKLGPDYDYFDYNSRPVVVPGNSTLIQALLPQNHERCFVDCLVTWIPDVANVPGEDFYVKYRIRGTHEGYNETGVETNEDFIIINQFNACKSYELILVTLYGEYKTESGTVLTPTMIF